MYKQDSAIKVTEGKDTASPRGSLNNVISKIHR